MTVIEADQFGFMGVCFFGKRQHLALGGRSFARPECAHETPFVDVLAHSGLEFDGTEVIRHGQTYIRRSRFVESEETSFRQSEFGVVHDDTQLEADGSLRDDVVGCRLLTEGSQHEVFYSACATLLRNSQPKSLASD